VPSALVDPAGQIALPSGVTLNWQFTRDGNWVSPSSVPSLRKRPFAVAGVEFAMAAGGSIRQRVVGRSAPWPVATVEFIDATRDGFVLRVELHTEGEAHLNDCTVFVGGRPVLVASSPPALSSFQQSVCSFEWPMAGQSLVLDLPLTNAHSASSKPTPLDESQIVAGWSHLGQWLPDLESCDSHLDAFVRGASIDIALGDARVSHATRPLVDPQTLALSWPDFVSSVRAAAICDVSRFHTIDDAMQFIEATSRRLFPTSAARIDAFALFDPSWRGQSVSASRFPTTLGTMSAAIRWHGNRPALLWQRVGGPDNVEITAPVLDAAFSSFERSGEALLADFAGAVDLR
jgi:hypothetical protein